MTTKKITLKFSLGDKVRSKFYEKTGEVTGVKYEEWGTSAKSISYMIRFDPGYERSCSESDLALAGLESDEFVDLEAEANK